MPSGKYEMSLTIYRINTDPKNVYFYLSLVPVLPQVSFDEFVKLFKRFCRSTTIIG